MSHSSNTVVTVEAVKNVSAGERVTFENVIINANVNDKSMSTQPDPEKIKDRDYTLIIDQSPSMIRLESEDSKRSRWNAIKEAAIKLAKHLEQKQYDPDGITVYTFSDDFKRYENADSTKVQEIFECQEPAEFGCTNIGVVLENALDSYFSRRDEHKKTLKKGETILVITDGEATDPQKVKEVIIDASKKVSGKGELGISFIQIGTDKEATDFLEYLDNELESPTGAKLDIVDTKTFKYIREKGLEFDDILLDALYN